MPTPPNQILLSVLILSIPSRLEKCLIPTYNRLLEQIGNETCVEVLTLVDNKSMSIGEKRQALIQSARGKWVAFLDDDDAVSEDYISTLIETLGNNPADVITFEQHCTVNGKEFKVDFRMGNPHEGLKHNPDGSLGDIKRPPYHMCVWAAKIAKNIPFRAVSYGEDIDWCSRMYPFVTSETHLDKVLHYYQYDDRTSESIQYAQR
jgi:glycosyltransferase involved in cell wall biosynthesis